MREIQLTQGKVALIDDIDYEEVAKNKWFYAVYAMRHEPRNHGHLIKMSRQIMDAPKGIIVDHINHDTLDNQRSNLRFCTLAQNIQNRQKARGLSRYKGVCWHKRHKKWMAYIMAKTQNHHLGYFTDENEAARAYNHAARRLHGEYACLNVIRPCMAEEMRF